MHYKGIGAPLRVLPTVEPGFDFNGEALESLNVFGAVVEKQGRYWIEAGRGAPAPGRPY